MKLNHEGMDDSAPATVFHQRAGVDASELLHGRADVVRGQVRPVRQLNVDVRINAVRGVSGQLDQSVQSQSQAIVQLD